MMQSKTDSNRTVDRLFMAVKGESLHDYTMIRSDKPSPLYHLADEYRRKNPHRQILVVALISEQTDVTAPRHSSYPKLWVEAKMTAELMPDSILKRLLSDKVNIEYNDGTGSYYNPVNSIISIKGAQDFIHEIGHHVWYAWLTREDENEKKSALMNSFRDGNTSRALLPDDLIPDAHKSYAGLIGGFSGQFIEDPLNTTLTPRKNDLEEHFARNIDLFMRGRPMDVTALSTATLEELLNFYLQQGLSETGHSAFYRYLLKAGHGIEYLNRVRPQEAKDGVEITRDELFQYHKNRIEFETGKELTLISQIGLALDLSEDFVEFCLTKNALKDIREALKMKGITLLTKEI
ncbi:MAG: hypothetical protein JW882_08595 [Deltaproteobacteria bacterium]|nr:hypothetical protein [Deltaproteobacteria bacterium]